MKSSGMLRSFHTSIVLRSAVIVLVVSGLVGYGMLGIISKFVEEKVQESFTNRLGEMVKTVENTARIACYLSDMGLASEVSKGLLMSRDVERVVIRSEQGVLVDIDRAAILKETQPSQTAGQAAGATAPATTAAAIPPNAIIRSLARRSRLM